MQTPVYNLHEYIIASEVYCKSIHGLNSSLTELSCDQPSCVSQCGVAENDGFRYYPDEGHLSSEDFQGTAARRFYD